jgi:polyisoprenoid-binding protein YceI
MLHKIVAVALMLAFALAPRTEAQPYRLNQPEAALHFAVRQFGAKLDGRFTDIDAALDFDRAAPAAARLAVTVRAASLQAGAATNAMLHAFEARQHPEIRFVSTRVEPSGRADARIEGLLTLRGVTKPIVLQARMSESDPPAFYATGVFRRSAFGVRAWPWTSDRVVLTIEAPFVE